MKKQNLTYLKNYFANDISLANQNCFNAILLPYDIEYEPYCIDCDLPMEEIYDIGFDLGWDQFYYVNFESKKEIEIDLSSLEVA